MAPRHSDYHCCAPPHPDVLAQLQTELLKVQGTDQEAASRAEFQDVAVGDRTGVIPGLNDGLIFPKSHFKSSDSVSTMIRAASARAPLRGALRSVPACFVSFVLYH